MEVRNGDDKYNYLIFSLERIQFCHPTALNFTYLKFVIYFFSSISKKFYVKNNGDKVRFFSFNTEYFMYC